MLAVKGHVDEQLQPALPQYSLVKGELWHHNVVTSTAASVTRSEATNDPGGSVVTSAFLHDLGKLVLCDYIARICYAEVKHESNLSAIERELVQIDHSELADVITRPWGLPEIISEALISHHEPSASTDPLAVHAVRLADVVAHQVLDPEDDSDARLVGSRSKLTIESLVALGIYAASLALLVSRTQEFVD